ncbi:MAG: cation transporter [Erysipelotrichaceae bacterium]
MKQLILVSDMNCENCAKKISDALSETRVDFEVILDSKTVVVNGDNDMAAVARRTINEAGFTII